MDSTDPVKIVELANLLDYGLHKDTLTASKVHFYGGQHITATETSGEDVLTLVFDLSCKFKNLHQNFHYETALMHPTKQMIALKRSIDGAGKTLVRVLNLNGSVSLAEVELLEAPKFWCWTSKDSLICVTTSVHQIYPPPVNQANPIFDLNPSLKTAQIVGYAECSDYWCFIQGLRADQGYIGGVSQLYHREKQVSQPLESLIGGFGEGFVRNSVVSSQLFSALLYNQPSQSLKLLVVELETPSDNSQKFKLMSDISPDMQLPFDHPLRLHIQKESGWIYILTTSGLFLIYSIQEGKLLLKKKICEERLLCGGPSVEGREYFVLNKAGAVFEISISGLLTHQGSKQTHQLAQQDFRGEAVKYLNQLEHQQREESEIDEKTQIQAHQGELLPPNQGSFHLGPGKVAFHGSLVAILSKDQDTGARINLFDLGTQELKFSIPAFVDSLIVNQNKLIALYKRQEEQCVMQVFNLELKTKLINLDLKENLLCWKWSDQSNELCIIEQGHPMRIHLIDIDHNNQHTEAEICINNFLNEGHQLRYFDFQPSKRFLFMHYESENENSVASKTMFISIDSKIVQEYDSVATCLDMTEPLQQENQKVLAIRKDPYKQSYLELQILEFRCDTLEYFITKNIGLHLKIQDCPIQIQSEDYMAYIVTYAGKIHCYNCLSGAKTNQIQLKDFHVIFCHVNKQHLYLLNDQNSLSTVQLNS